MCHVRKLLVCNLPNRRPTSRSIYLDRLQLCMQIQHGPFFVGRADPKPHRVSLNRVVRSSGFLSERWPGQQATQHEATD
jgi:hypothetical protein